MFLHYYVIQELMLMKSIYRLNFIKKIKLTFKLYLISYKRIGGNTVNSKDWCINY